METILVAAQMGVLVRDNVTRAIESLKRLLLLQQSGFRMDGKNISFYVMEAASFGDAALLVQEHPMKQCIYSVTQKDNQLLVVATMEGILWMKEKGFTCEKILTDKEADTWMGARKNERS